MSAQPPARSVRALFLAPLMPSRTGNGLAMRAGLLLGGLAAEHAVTVWVVPVAAGRADPPPSTLARELAERIVITPPEEDPRWRLAASLPDSQARARALDADPRPFLARFATSGAVARLRDAADAAPFGRILVLRSYLAPFALPLLGCGSGDVAPRSILDLDDDEALTRRRLAALHRQRGETAAAEREEREAVRFETLEEEVVPRFDRIVVCHDEHRSAVIRSRGLDASRVALVPNAVELPNAVAVVPDEVESPPPGGSPDRSSSTEPGAGRPIRLLLVGNLGYLPNQDAAERLAREIAPAVAERSGRPVRVRIVGANPSAPVRRLAEDPAIEVWSDVPDVAPHYAWADLAVVPLRAGGGTRIKILEAFAHRVPVIATAVAAEGLAVEAGRHLLVGETVAELAAACGWAADDPELSARLRTEARSLVESRYERSAVRESIRALLETV